MAQLGLLTGVFNLIPSPQGVQFSDGEQLRRALRGGPLLEELKRVSLAEVSLGTPLRPRAWSRDFMAPVLEARTACSRYDRYLAYVHLLDSENPEAAHPWLARCAAEWSKTDPCEYAVEAAYYLGIYERNASGAALWLSRALKDKSISSADRLRAEAASAWASGRTAEAERLAHAALAKLDEELPSGWVEYQRTRLNDLLQLASTSQNVIAAMHTLDVAQ
jgi:hypothetical protein